MNEAQGISVADMVRSLQIKGVPLPHEVGTFLALQVCEALMERPREIDSDQVHVDTQGHVKVDSGPRVPELSAAKGVVTLLGEVLVASAPGVPEVLLTLLDLEPLAQRSKPLDALRDELEAALVPLNRDATTRILGRLAKDAFGNARANEAEPRRTSDRALTSAIDDLLGIDTEAADAFVDRVSEPPGAKDEPASGEVERAAAEARVSKALGDMERTGEKPHGGFKVAALLVLCVLVAVFAALWARKSNSPLGSHKLPQVSAPKVSQTSAPSPVAPVQSSTLAGRLSLDSSPQGAQVLMAIADTSKPLILEAGIAHEFVVVLPSGKHIRRVLAADALRQDATFEQPLTLTIEEVADAGAANSDLGPSKLRAEALGEPNGHTAALHFQVPEDAKVYKFVGITPAQIAPLSTTQDVTFLLYHGGYAHSIVSVNHTQWDQAAVDGGTTTLSLHQTLQPHS